ncbi:hypothetical protein NE619_01000 [Anaerovorax odorimutans]|uniref:Uncharacterized protein n=1 Tax=Anaerovorax odorimutans TaxID=109327 RepID=A0ABT1RJF9_9FIRM|nr:hypothetical protein [Anaerovorax odorimutans]MCQ4635308.1 hypothetical protein [Anaerovorax odorimutans]
MKATKSGILVSVLLALLIVVSMVMNIQNGKVFEIGHNPAPSIEEWKFFGWWAVSFASALLLFGASRVMFSHCRKAFSTVACLVLILVLGVLALLIF